MGWQYWGVILLSVVLTAGCCFYLGLEKRAVKLVKNMDNGETLPRNFRIIAHLQASGSGQFSAKSLDAVLKALPVAADHVIIVDLREEAHGFADGTAISWYGEHNWENKGKGAEEIEKQQALRLQALESEGFMDIYSSKRVLWMTRTPVSATESEEELVRSLELGVGYRRFYVTDHSGPSDATVKEFLAFIRELQPGTWLHFHCAAGRGRTTTFLAMYDIIQNGSEDSFDTIVKRQYLLGGVDLSAHTSVPYKQEAARERFELLRRFYNNES